MIRLTAAIAALALALAASPAGAQGTTGSISGRITDQQGAVVPGVTVEARHRESGFTRTGISDEAGTYHLGALPVGAYHLTADLAGFRRFESPAVEVVVARRSVVDPVMEIGAITDAVTVTLPALPLAVRS